MKILVGIPVITGYKHTMDAINSVLNQPNVELLIIDNNATEDVKHLFTTYEDCINFKVKVNEKNIYVNPAWNQIMEAFLNDYTDFDILCIMNSDLTLQNNWSDMLRSLYDNNSNASYLPRMVNDCVAVERLKEIDINNCEGIETEGGSAGIFITLSRKQVKEVYPIPNEIKVWFGDNWIYDTLRHKNYKTIVAHNLIAFHGLSQTITRVEGIDEIIEHDKVQWYSVVEPTIKNK